MYDEEEIFERMKQDTELRESICRDIGKFTVPLLALSLDKTAEDSMAGTGTLITLEGNHYILTAAHVWETRLRRSTKIGLPIVAGITHEHRVDTDTITPSAELKPRVWNEWGPDLILLRVPSEYLSELCAHKIFYDPFVDGKPAPANAKGVETRVLIGTPAELGTYTHEPKHADFTVQCLFVDVNAPFFDHDTYDYVDFSMDTDFSGHPKDFGGFSGGGLWDVTVYCSPEAGAIDWSRTLKGVAFHQSDLVDARRTIRCHGSKSLDALTGKL